VDRKMKLVYAGLMVLLMVGASVGTVVAENMNYAYLTENEALYQAASDAALLGSSLSWLALTGAGAWFLAGYGTTVGVVAL